MWILGMWSLAAAAAPIELGGAGTWDLPERFHLAASEPVDGTGLALVLRHEVGEVTALVLPRTQALSLRDAGRGALVPAGTRPPEPEVVLAGELAWWLARADGGTALSTGLGGTSVVVLAPPGIVEAELTALAAGLSLSWDPVPVDETWARFDLPRGVAVVHQEASPYSYTRGDGIVAVDVSFDREREEAYPPPPGLEALAEGLPGWSLVSGAVRFDFQSNNPLNEAEAWDAERRGRASVAAPGSNLGARAVAAIRRDGLLRLEVRAEGADAPILAHNDLARIAASASTKARYDWFHDARRARWRRDRVDQAALMAAAGPLTESASAAVDALMAGGLTAAGSAGLSAAQLLPVAYFELYELGRSKTPTEDGTVGNMGYVPAGRLSLRDYWGEDSELVTTSRAVGVEMSVGARVFRQRAWTAVNYQLVWPQPGADSVFTPAAAPPAAVSEARIQPYMVKMRSGLNVDPLTWLLPHRFGTFGDVRVGVGLGNVLGVVRGRYLDAAGEEQGLWFLEIGFAPTFGFQARLFADTVYLYGDGYWAPSQLSLVGFARDSAARSALEADVDGGTGVGEAFAKGGVSGLMSRAMGSALPRGSRGLHLSAVVGLPFAQRPSTASSIGMPAGQGALPPLGGKTRRALARSTLGVGVSWFLEESRYTSMAKPWGVVEEDFTLVHTGLLFGLGFSSLNLPAFGSGGR
jgi:hypothetical protein